MARYAEITYEDIIAEVVAAHTAGALLARYKMNEASGDLIDSSGNGNDMDNIVATPTYEEPSIHRGPDFAGSIGFTGTSLFYASDNSDFDCGTEITISLWINHSAANTRALAARHDAADAGWFIRLASGGGLFASLTGSNFTSADIGVDDGNPHHIVVTHISDVTNMYVDGLLFYTVADTGSIRNGTSNDLIVGSQYNTAQSAFDGDICDFQLWDEAWTAEEVAKVARAGFAYQSNEHDDVQAAFDAEYGDPTFGLSMSDLSATTDEVGSHTIAINGNPTLGSYGPILGSGELTILLDGTGDWVDYKVMDAFFNHGGDWWMSGWVKTPNSSSFYLIDSWEGTNAGLLIYLSGGNNPTMRLAGGNVSPGPDPGLDEWVRLDAWWDSTDGKFYGSVNAGTPASSTKTYVDQTQSEAVLPSTGAGGSKVGSVSRILIYDRLPAGGEISALYRAARKLVTNFDSDTDNNADYADTDDYWTDHAAIVTADKYMIHLAIDETLVLTHGDEIASDTYENLIESAIQYPAIIAGLASDVTITYGTVAGLAIELDHFRLEGLTFTFADSGGTASSGFMFTCTSNDNIWDSCVIDLTGDSTTATIILSTDGILRNCLIEINGDHSSGAHSILDTIGHLEHTTVVRFGTGSTNYDINTLDTITNSAIFGLDSPYAGSVWKDTNETSGLDIDDNFGDAAGGDYSALDSGDVYQSGTPIDGVLTDSENTVWSDPESPNCSHLNTLFVSAGTDSPWYYFSQMEGH